MGNEITITFLGITITFLGIIVALIGGFLVGISWALHPGVSLGEASCGSTLTMIFILVILIWWKLNNSEKGNKTK